MSQYRFVEHSNDEEAGKQLEGGIKFLCITVALCGDEIRGIAHYHGEALTDVDNEVSRRCYAVGRTVAEAVPQMLEAGEAYHAILKAVAAAMDDHMKEHSEENNDSSSDKATATESDSGPLNTRGQLKQHGTTIH